MKNHFATNSGFSIVEIMVALGLLGAVSLGIMKIMENSQKASKNIENKDEMSQQLNLISDILRNPNNCQVSLNGRTLNQDVPIIYQVINATSTPKFTISSAPTNKVSVTSIKVKRIDLNGSIGDQALATLEVQFKKPGNSSIGGQTIKKEIHLNANLCRRNILQNTDQNALLSSCSGSYKKLVDGPYAWNNAHYIICQDCTNATEQKINFCQSQGGGGGSGSTGIDIGNVSQFSCANLGGTYDESSSRCKFDGMTLEAFIDSRINQHSSDALGTLAQELIDQNSPTCGASEQSSLEVVNGKIRLKCTPPSGACTCTQWASWQHKSTGYICTSEPCAPWVGFFPNTHRGTYTLCTYERSCYSTSHAGCGVAPESRSQTLTTAYPNDYTGRAQAQSATCPPP